MFPLLACRNCSFALLGVIGIFERGIVTSSFGHLDQHTFRLRHALCFEAVRLPSGPGGSTYPDLFYRLSVLQALTHLLQLSYKDSHGAVSSVCDHPSVISDLSTPPRKVIIIQHYGPIFRS